MEQIKDVEGNHYRYTKIDDLHWTIDNFRCQSYSNGDAIIRAFDDQEYLSAGNQAKGVVCDINNDSSLSDIHGKLYNWFAVHDNRRIAPEGWRIPTEEDWLKIETHLANERAEGVDCTEKYNLRYSGSRGINGAFGGYGKSGYWWRSMPESQSLMENWGRRLNLNANSFEKIDGFQRFGFSVRLVRDDL